MTKQYVLGLAFWNYQVALIYKTKGPEYVIDTWNGIGGKIEEQDHNWSELAMSREFCEETGLFIGPDLWIRFATQTGKSWDGPDYELNCFAAFLPGDEPRPNIENTEGAGERVQWWSLNHLPGITPNLKWLIPLALDDTTGVLVIQER